MKIIKKYNSFAFFCAVTIVVYSFMLLIFYGIISYITSVNLNKSFPTMENILEYSNELKQDNYYYIPIHKYNDSSLIIFDNNGHAIYASDSRVRQNIHYKDLNFINDYNSNLFYEVSQSTDDFGEIYYVINLELYDSDSNISIINDSCVLDKDYKIIDGTLFPDREYLDKRDLNLMQGIIDGKMNISKLSYRNNDDELRTAVFISPNLNGTVYKQIVNENKKIWIYAFPVFLIIVFFQVYIFTNCIKKSIVPFKNAIITYRNDSKIDINEENIPLELQPTVHEFMSMVKELEKAENEKEKINQDKQRIITNISHDLKTPLTVIKGFSEAILDHKVPKEKEYKYLQTIYNRSVAANNLINSLFEYVKIEHPDYNLTLERVDICEFVKQFLARKYNEIERKGFTIEVMIPDELIYLELDKIMFIRVLDNIVEDSLKYNPLGTTIYVEIYKKKDLAILTISDNGTGIDEELIKDIFIPFTTGDKARSMGKGTGLGLSISKKIVELHSGTIDVVSSGKGTYATQFIIKLPLANG